MYIQILLWYQAILILHALSCVKSDEVIYFKKTDTSLKEKSMLVVCLCFQKKRQRQLQKSWARWTACLKGQPITDIRYRMQYNSPFSFHIFTVSGNFFFLGRGYVLILNTAMQTESQAQEFNFLLLSAALSGLHCKLLERYTSKKHFHTLTG